MDKKQLEEMPLRGKMERVMLVVCYDCGTQISLSFYDQHGKIGANPPRHEAAEQIQARGWTREKQGHLRRVWRCKACSAV